MWFSSGFVFLVSCGLGCHAVLCGCDAFVQCGLDVFFLLMWYCLCFVISVSTGFNVVSFLVVLAGWMFAKPGAMTPSRAVALGVRLKASRIKTFVLRTGSRIQGDKIFLPFRHWKPLSIYTYISCNLKEY